MAVFRPGEFTITDKATEIAGLKKGDRVIDIGCGEGDTVAHLAEKFGFDTVGIDMNLSRISEANESIRG
ncbi:MAG: methyltransferase domain-containing protein [Anaerovoracaceae bacterium]